MSRTARDLRTLAGVLAVVSALSAQSGSPPSGRDAYREAFKAWRQNDPSLERDAATTPDLSARAAAEAAAAARYTTARAAYLRAAVAQANQAMLTLNSGRLTPEPDLAPATDLQRLVSESTEQVTAQITTYGGDADPALQPVRQALTRERSALVALSGAINDRQNAASKAAAAMIAVEQARTRTLEPFQAIAGGFEGAATGVEQEALAWAEYYRKLTEGANAAIAGSTAAPPAVTVAPANGASPAPATVGGVRINNPARGLAATDAATTGGVRINDPAGSGAPRVNNPPLAAAPVTPLNRFVGSWTFPVTGGLYHGPQPDVINFEVKEENGMLRGTMDGRFWPFGDINAVTTLHFEFSGTPGTGRVLSFPLVTKEGAKGNIDLIPGPAFNLLEINYYTDRVPGKLNRGNLLLIRK